MSHGLALGVSPGPSRNSLLPSRPGLLAWLDASIWEKQFSDAAIQFNAADKSWLQITDANQTGLDPLTDDFWISLWVKPDSLSSYQSLIRKGNPALSGGGYWLYVNNVGTLTLAIGDGTQVLASSSGGALSVGEWKHIILNCDRDGNAVVYVNGVAAITADISARTGSINTTEAFAVGSLTIGTYFFDGAIDSLAFGKGTILDATARARLYNNGLGLISSDITLTEKLAWGGVSWWDFSESVGRRWDSWGTNHLDQAFAPIIAPAVYGPELLSGGNFETAGTLPAVFNGWGNDAGAGSISADTSTYHSGTQSAKIVGGGSVWYQGQVTQVPSVTAGASYRLSFWTRGDGVNAGLYAVLDVTNDAYIRTQISTNVNGTGWGLVTYDFTAPAGCSSVRIYLAANGTVAGAIAYFDDVSLKQVVTPAINNGGFENWTVPASTNLVTNGQDFSGTTYYNTVTVTGTLSPDATGTYTATGWYNGLPYYRRGSDNYFIWWNGSTYWILSTELGVSSGARWLRVTVNTHIGTFTPVDPATGTATVANDTGSGTFAVVPTEWTAVNANLSTVAGGASGNCLQVENSGAATGYARQSFTTIVGAVYALTFWHKNGTAGGIAYVGDTQGGSQLYSSGTMNDADWTKRTVYFTATTTTTYFNGFPSVATAAATTLFDTIELIQLPSNADAWMESVAGTSRIRREDTEVYSGSHALAMDVDASESVVNVVLHTLTHGKLYTASVAAKINTTLAGDNFYFGFGTTTGEYRQSFSGLTTSFATYSRTYRAGGISFVVSRGAGGSAGRTIYLDSVTLTAAEIQATQGIARSQTQDANFAVQLNGTSQYLSYTGTAFNPGTGDFTLGCAFYLDALPAVGSLFGRGTTSVDQHLVWVYVDGSASKLYVQINNGSGARVILAGPVVSVGNFYTCIIKYDRDGNCVIKLNGVETVLGSIAAKAGSLELGGLSVGARGAGSDPFLGRIDNAFYCTRLTTDAEDTWLHNSGKWRQWAELGVAGTDGANLNSSVIPGFFEFDDAANLGYNSAGSAHLTPQGSPTQGNGINYAAGNVARIESRYGSVVATQSALSKRPYLVANVQNGKPGLYFKGVDDLLTMPNFSSATEGTVYLVFKTSSDVTTAQNLLGTADEAGTSNYWGIQIASGRLLIAQRNADTADSVTATTTDIAANTTYIAVLRSNGSAYSIRVNGVEQTLTVGGGANNGDWWGDTDGRDSFVLGASKRSSEGSFLNGYIMEVLPYDRYHVDSLVRRNERFLGSKWSITL